MRIEILISTLNDGLFDIKINEKYIYLIVHQITLHEKIGVYEKYFLEKLKNNNVRYIQSNTIGLSKSRNIALKNSVGDILWIMDDDVEILESTHDKIINSYRNTSYDILILNHTTAKNKTSSYNIKQYKHNIISSAKIHSIDISFRKKIKEKILFDESFGLGTKLPSGEEYIFITDAIKANFSVYQTNIIASAHPNISSGVDFYSTKEKIIAKRKMLDRIFRKLSLILTILFIFKKTILLIKKKKLLSFIRYALFK
ncbi:glycosyltransferase [Xenorhabdus ishibashii]|uniref:Glycosyltransferase 2-like domain-containing protein n=1 Tax=Xenorhabdus ishibashii TaxID=1034471 RepID=A0A2D0KG18_9GAMM|nr:glycosyltransferase [Xenorhabdus ishibashii]PHM62373.1 hypothetical protein Xish_01575 [Xenorhabdus ishibashii]